MADEQKSNIARPTENTATRENTPRRSTRIVRVPERFAPMISSGRSSSTGNATPIAQETKETKDVKDNKNNEGEHENKNTPIVDDMPMTESLPEYIYLPPGHEHENVSSDTEVKESKLREESKRRVTDARPCNGHSRNRRRRRIPSNERHRQRRRLVEIDEDDLEVAL